MQAWTELIIHELAHDKVSGHLSEAFHDKCCRIGARYAAHLQRLLAEQQVHQR
jgi:predicted metal-dependent hydrolase